MPAERAVYFANVFFLYGQILAPVSQNLPDQIFRIGRCMRGSNNVVFHLAIPKGTLPRQPILEVKSEKLVTYFHLSC